MRVAKGAEQSEREPRLWNGGLVYAKMAKLWSAQNGQALLIR